MTILVFMFSVLTGCDTEDDPGAAKLPAECPEDYDSSTYVRDSSVLKE